MGIRFKRFPEYRLDINVYAGAVSYEELLRHVEMLDGRANWLSYLNATADLAAIEVAHFPALKHVVAVKEAERSENEPARQALVFAPTALNDLYVHFWRDYASTVRNPRQRAVFATLEEACRWLGLPPAGCEAVAAEVDRAGRILAETDHPHEVR